MMERMEGRGGFGGNRGYTIYLFIVIINNLTEDPLQTIDKCRIIAITMINVNHLQEVISINNMITILNQITLLGKLHINNNI